MIDDPLYHRVIAMLTQVTTVPPSEIRPESSLQLELAMDSVSSLEMLGLLSEEFGIEVELEETEHLQTVGQVVALIRERGGLHA